MKKEVIDLDANWYGGGFHFQLLKDNNGLVTENYFENRKPSIIKDLEVLNFWKKMDKINVWKWHKKYPYWKQKYEPLTDGCVWELKLRNKNGRVKYSTGHESFPRDFKKLIKELNILFGANIKF